MFRYSETARILGSRLIAPGVSKKRLGCNCDGRLLVVCATMGWRVGNSLAAVSGCRGCIREHCSTKTGVCLVPSCRCFLHALLCRLTWDRIGGCDQFDSYGVLMDANLTHEGSSAFSGNCGQNFIHIHGSGFSCIPMLGSRATDFVGSKQSSP